MTDSVATSKRLADLIERAGASDRSLELYLTALLRLAAAEQERERLSFQTFVCLLEAALVELPEPPAPASGRAAAGYVEFERTVRDQIVDLREMEVAGVFSNEQRFFGVDAPRGARWYN